MLRSATKIVYSSLLALLLVCTVSISAVLAAPADPFVGVSSHFDEPREDSINYNLGDWGVAEQRGAATYTYPIPVPPGRNGMAPDLALRYSSRSPLRGGLAVGWTFDVPSIGLDHSLGQESTRIYQASLRAASGRLVKVPDPPTPLGYSAYRLEFDDSFTRFYRADGPLGASSWTALTTDGVKHYFGDEPDASLFLTRWLITRQVDPHGNTIHYFWAKLASGPYTEYSLQRIEYTSNSGAGLAAHARVDFSYGPVGASKSCQEG
jgi:hypothetical protein